MAVAIQDKVLQRRVPNGKVYRQLFDAEVKLVKALDQTRIDLPTRLQLPRCTSVPVARPAVVEPGCGMLTERQLTWLQELPNESTTENPVLYKFYADESKEKIKMCEVESRPRAEVKGLPDVLVPAKLGSDIIERISSNRKLRHDAAVEDMQQELGLVSSELEPIIESHCHCAVQKLDDNNTELESFIDRISSDEVLMNYTKSELDSLWVGIAQQFKLRKVWIDELDQVLVGVEHNRVAEMRGIFDRSWKTLEKIAHIPVPDMQRIMDKECQLINQIVLNNKRMYAELKSKLLFSDVDREHKLLVHWRKRVGAWTQLNMEDAVNSFTVFMARDDVVHSPKISQLMQELSSQQTELNGQRIDLIKSLREVNPPALSVQFFKSVYKEILNISKRIDEVNQTFFSKLCLEYEAICQTCLGEVMRIKENLVIRCVCTEEEASDILNKRCLPFVGERQSIFERTLEALDKATEEESAKSLKQLKQLFKFGQAAAQLWGTHEVCLARLDNVLQEKLDAVRLQHDAVNQDREAALDVILDRMRQDVTDAALKESLAKVMQMLANIRLGYDEFFDQQKAVLAGYPQTIEAEIKLYADSVCLFFGIERVSDDSKLRNAQLTSPRAGATSPSVQMLIGMLGSEVLETKNGTKYTIIPDSKTLKLPSSKSSIKSTEPNQRKSNDATSAPLTTPVPSTATVSSATAKTEGPPETASDACIAVSVKAISIEEQLVVEVCQALRLNMLNHLDDWSEESVRRTAIVVDTKTTELKSELDLRIHLHEPRARRAELDVHNVRAAELAMHSERVSRHINGVEQTLVELRSALRSMMDSGQQRIEQFRADVDKFEKIFVAAKKSSRLMELKKELSKMQIDVMVEVKSSLERFRNYLENSINNLRTSSAQFLLSFKLFSDGGNFSPMEAAEYSKRIEKANQKIDAMEEQLLAELKTVEPKLSDQSAKVVQSFELRFQNDLSDLQFVEKVARWLSNCQVKVKTEVADSNAQSCKIAQSLDVLERMIIGCESPSLDTGFYEPIQLVNALDPLFVLVKERSIYLDCLKDADLRRSASASQPVNKPVVVAAPGVDGTAAKFISENGIPAISKPGGKAPADDAAVLTIRQILKTQKVRSTKDGLDGEAAVKSDSVDSLAMIASNTNTSGKKPTAAVKSAAKSKEAGSADAKKRSGPAGKGAAGGAGKNKMDVKYLVFGEVAEPDESVCFNKRVKAIMRDTLSAILATAEAAYKVKGTRLTTKPDLMQETLEQCAESVIQKLQSYVAQSEDYCNKCVQEFRQQLVKLEGLAGRVPGCVMRNVLSSAVSEAGTEQDHHTASFNELRDNLESMKEWHNNALRPTLGHPQQLPQLEELCEKEEDRSLQMISAIDNVTRTRKDCLLERCRVFADILIQSTNQLLVLLDQMIVSTDIIASKVEPVKHTPCELVRRWKAGQALEDEPPVEIVAPIGPVTWPDLPLSDLTCVPTPAASSQELASSEKSQSQQSVTSKRSGQESVASKRTGSESVTCKQSSTESVASKRSSKKNTSKKLEPTTVVTNKATEAHRICVCARDEAYEEFKRFYETTLQHIDLEYERLCMNETRFAHAWKSSVDKIRQLY